MDKEKRKTKTSAAVKNKYAAKAYGTVLIKVDKTLVELFKQKCKERGVSQAQVLKKAMEEYLAEE